MNNVNLIGRLTNDIELRHTNNGKAVCSFCVAVKGVQDTSYFIDCTAWEARAENIAKYFHKGDKIGIAGMLTTRTWTDSDGKNRKATEVLINSFDFCTEKKEATGVAPVPESTTSFEPSGELPFEV